MLVFDEVVVDMVKNRYVLLHIVGTIRTAAAPVAAAAGVGAAIAAAGAAAKLCVSEHDRATSGCFAHEDSICCSKHNQEQEEQAQLVQQQHGEGL